jgi:hypothetical protein
MLAVACHFTYNTPMEKGQEQLVRQAHILLDRLERLSADSVWAHKASGVRGSLIRSLQKRNTGESDQKKMRNLVGQGYQILYRAAREIPDHRENQS